MAYNVLIIDDSELTRSVLTEMLTSRGHAIVGEAETGEAGLAAFKSLKPDLVTLDISLPDMDGLSVARELRAIAPAVRIVFISGNDQQRILDFAKTLKVPLVSKPFAAETLFAAIEKAGTPAA
jgi:two-component system chemotaxis response regulator CheY